MNQARIISKRSPPNYPSPYCTLKTLTKLANYPSPYCTL